MEDFKKLKEMLSKYVLDKNYSQEFFKKRILEIFIEKPITLPSGENIHRTPEYIDICLAFIDKRFFIIVDIIEVTKTDTSSVPFTSIDKFDLFLKKNELIFDFKAFDVAFQDNILEIEEDGTCSGI